MGASTASSSSERAAGGLVGHPLGLVVEQLESGVPAAGVAAGLDAVGAAGDHLGAEPHARAVVGGRAAVRVEDLHLAARLPVAHAHLRHLRPRRSRALVEGTQQLGLARRLDLLRAHRHRMAVRSLRGRQGGRPAGLAADGLGHRVRHAQQVLLRVAVHVAVVGRVAAHHPHARTALATRLRALHPTVVEREREARAGLGVQLGQLAAPRERVLQHGGGQLGRDEAHRASSPSALTWATMSSATSITRAWPRASGCTSRA